MPRGTKRKAVDLEADQDGESSATVNIVDASAKAKAARSKTRRLARLEEYEEDPGREESRMFQKWAQAFDKNLKTQEQKSQALFKEFCGKITEQKDQVLQQQKQQNDQLIRECEALLGDIKNICSTTLEIPTPSGNNQKGKEIDGKESHILFREAQSLISQSSTMLREFKETDERLKTYKLELPVAQWKQDKRQMKELVASGRQEAGDIVKHLLIPNGYPTPKVDRHGATDTQDLNLFEESNKALQGDNWGTTASEQAAHLTAMVRKLLPEGNTTSNNNNIANVWVHETQ